MQSADQWVWVELRIRAPDPLEASGGDLGVDLLRGRSRPEPAPAQGPHLGPRGRTPVVRVSGKGSGRVSVAGLACLPARARAAACSTGCVIHRGRKGERRSMSEADYAGLVTAAHHQLPPRSC